MSISRTPGGRSGIDERPLIALFTITAERLQMSFLLPCFDPLRSHAQMERLREFQNTLHDRGVHRVVTQLLNKRAIDL
jgi:hypothetical protein